MANIVLNIDTSKKTTSLKVDGKEWSDFSEMWVSGADSGYGFRVEISKEEEGEDLRKTTRLTADENGELIVQPDNSEVVNQISSYFSNKRCKTR